MNDKIEIKSIENIAIIQTAFIGDVVLSMNLAEEVKQMAPDCCLTFVSRPATVSLLSAQKAIDNVISYDKHGLHSGLKGIKAVAEELKQKNVTCVVAPHRSLRTSLLARLTGAEYRIGFNKNAFSFLYNYKVKYIKNIHEIERNRNLLSVFQGYSNHDFSQSRVGLEFSDEDLFFVHSKLSVAGFYQKDDLIAIAPGSVWNTKKWPEEYYIELASELKQNGYKVIIIGSGDDKILCENIAKHSSAYSLAGETTINQTVYMLSLTKLLISNDSAPVHFAGLTGCKTIAIFGPTVPEFGFYPRGADDRVIELDELKCRPCRIHGSKRCPRKTHECMKKILPGKVYDEAIEILNQ